MWRALLLILPSLTYASPISDHVGMTEAFDTVNDYLPRAMFLFQVDHRMKKGCPGDSTIHTNKKYQEIKKHCSAEIAAVLLAEAAKSIRIGEEVDILNMSSADTFKFLCRLSPQIVDCISKFSGASDTCMKHEEQELLNNKARAYIDFMCHNDGERLIQFERDGGSNCFESRKISMFQCLNNTDKDLRHDDKGPREPVDRHSSGSSLIPNTVEDCREELDGAKCVINKMKECSSPGPAVFMEGLINAGLKVSPCAKYIHG